MVDENTAVSSETDDTTEATTDTTVETSAEETAAQVESEAKAAEQGDKPGDEATDAEAKTEEKDDKAGKPEEEPEKKPNRKSASERISQLTQIRRDQEREIKRLNAQLERTQKLERPDPNKYEDSDEYASDLAAYKVRTSQTDDIQASVKDAEARATEALSTAHSERVMDFLTDAPDFHQVAGNPALQITPEMANEIMDSDYGPQIQYHLGKNPREAARIAALSQSRQIREIGRLEAEVSRPAAKRVTQAPAPIKPVAGKRVNPAFDPNKATPEEYAKKRAEGWEG